MIRSRYLLLSPLFTLALLAGGCQVTDRQVIDQADQAHSGLKPAVINDRELADYIQAVGDRIIDAAKEADRAKVGPPAHFNDKERDWMFSQKMQFHFVNSKTINAFTTGGEHMYVYTELFQNCADENDLAAVMSHEFAHVYSRHVQKGTQRQYGILGAALAAGAGGALLGGKDNAAQYGSLAGGAALALGQVAGATFTRGDEAEADKYGFYFYTHAGWDPERFGHFFQVMIDKGLDKGVAFLSDHPTLASRVQVAKDRARELGPDGERLQKPPVANASRFRDLQDRAARLAKTLPNDKSLAQTQELLQALPRSCLTPAVQDDQVQAQKRLKRDLEGQDRKRTSASSSGASSSGASSSSYSEPASPDDTISAPPSSSSRRHRPAQE
jgi:predicted Zn-dependent protease